MSIFSQQNYKKRPTNVITQIRKAGCEMRQFWLIFFTEKQEKKKKQILSEDTDKTNMVSDEKEIVVMRRIVENRQTSWNVFNIWFIDLLINLNWGRQWLTWLPNHLKSCQNVVRVKCSFSKLVFPDLVLILRKCENGQCRSITYTTLPNVSGRM